MNFMLKLLIIMGIVFTASSYVIFRIYGNRKVTNLVVFGIVFFPFLLRVFTRYNGRMKIIEILDGNYLFFYTYFILAIIFIGLAHIILKIFRISFLEILSSNKKKLNILFLIYLLSLGIIGKINFNHIDIKTEKISFNKKLEKDNIKIGFISDIHLGLTFNGEKLEKVLSAMEKQGVEAILIGGDFLDNTHLSVKDDIKARLDRYKFEKGIFLILGNHEYYGGINQNIKYIESLGIKIIRDEVITIDGIKIVGRDDKNTNRYGGKKKEITQLYEKGKIVKSDPVIVVEHNPESVMESVDAGADLYLAGHTHNGQFFPFNLVVERMYVKAYGKGKIEETKVVMSSGLGTWLIPYRLGSQSEAYILEISNTSH